MESPSGGAQTQHATFLFPRLMRAVASSGQRATSRAAGAAHGSRTMATSSSRRPREIWPAARAEQPAKALVAAGAGPRWRSRHPGPNFLPRSCMLTTTRREVEH